MVVLWVLLYYYFWLRSTLFLQFVFLYLFIFHFIITFFPFTHKIKYVFTFFSYFFVNYSIFLFIFLIFLCLHNKYSLSSSYFASLFISFYSIDFAPFCCNDLTLRLLILSINLYCLFILTVFCLNIHPKFYKFIHFIINYSLERPFLWKTYIKPTH